MSVKPAAQNQPDDIKIRKCRDILVTGGLAMVAFGAWTLIRGVLDVAKELGGVLNNMSYEGLTEEEAAAARELIESNALFYGILAMIIAIMAVDLIIRIYVGLSARAVGLGKKKKNGKERTGILWLIFGIILAIIGCYSLISSLMSAGQTLQEHSVTHFVIQLFVEATSLWVTVELVITGFRLRALTKNQKETEEVRDAA